MTKAKFLAAASVIALGLVANANAADDHKHEGKIKCEFTQTEDGKNDCGTAKHSCAGKAKKGDTAWKNVASEKECADLKGKIVKEEKKEEKKH